MDSDIYDYLVNEKVYSYKPSWTECLRLTRNIGQHWYDQPRPRRQPEPFYKIGDHKAYFLKTFHNLPVRVNAAVRSNDEIKTFPNSRASSISVKESQINKQFLTAKTVSKMLVARKKSKLSFLKIFFYLNAIKNIFPDPVVLYILTFLVNLINIAIN